METAIGNNDGVPCPHCREPFSINLNEVHEDSMADGIENGASISTIGLPSLKELPHVSSGNYLSFENSLCFLEINYRSNNKRILTSL